MAWLDGKGTVVQSGLDDALRRGTKHVRGRDPVVAQLVRAHGPCRLRSTRNHFQVLLETITSQQVSTKAARAIYDRVVACIGGGQPTPAKLGRVQDSQLLAAGLSRAKVQYVRNAAAFFSERRRGPAFFGRLSDEEVVAALTEIRGVGEWSAHMFLIFALNRVDVFPIGDLGLRNAMMAQYRLRKSTPTKRLQSIAEPWRPYRTVGTLYLWKSYDNI